MKALFFDIDGTLVPIGHKGMTPSTLAALDAARAAGHKLFINTGRARYFIDNLGDYPFDGFVCANGSLVEMGGRVVYKRPVDKADAARIIDICETARIPCVAFMQDSYRINFLNERVEEVSRAIHTEFPDIGPLECVKEEDILEFTIYVTPEEERKYFGHIPTVIFPRWLGIFTDCTHYSTSKAHGIAQVARLLGIGMEDTVAFGDGGNDISMLRAAGLGVAMANALPEVKAAAGYIAPAAADDGIARAFKDLGLVK